MHRWFWVAVVVASCLGACGGGSKPGDGLSNAAGHGNDQSGGASSAGNGGADATEPAGGAGAASCTFTPDPAPVFDACGGVPYGVWQATALETRGFAFGIAVSQPNGGSSLSSCPTAIPSEPMLKSFLLELDVSGKAQLSLDIGAFLFQMQDSCVKAASGGHSCTEISGFDCTTSACGVCTCTYPASTGASTGTFVNSDNAIALTFGNSSSGALPDPYCVKDGVLHLQNPSGEIITFQPVKTAGPPADCSLLSLEVCGKTDGCTVGSCSGISSSCARLFSQEGCELEALCRWDPTQCSGTATAGCAFSDYGVVPGCDLVPPTAKCVGDTKPDCSSYTTADACTAVDGCQAASLCSGTSPCSYYNGACDLCNDTAGCLCDSGGSCTGSIACTGNTEAACTSRTGCHWSPFVCQGTATQCADVPLDSCVQTPGCKVDAGT